VSGWVIPGYTELKELGSGGFGAVMLARHDATGTPVAIKYLRPELAGDPYVAEMFRAEAITLGSLDDPHVTRLYEYVETPAGAAIIMELVDGVTLREILSRFGKTSPEAALVVLYGSLLGLAAAHARGVVHRDYKPTNVLVNAYGASKLTDFGIAVLAGTDIPTGATAAYAPPEQWDAAPASPASDVYAATVTFYECLTGGRPFTGQSDETLASQHRYSTAPMAPIPEPLRPLVARGMAKDPQYRPANAAALAAELRAVAAGAYGEAWESQGRSQLGEAALLLAALWPTAGVAALQGATIEQVRLSQSSQGSQGSQSHAASQASHPSQGPQSHAVSRAERHRRHLGHVRHEEHLEHLRYLREHGQQGNRTSALRKASRAGHAMRTAGVAVTAVAVAAAIGTVAATGRSHSPSAASAGHPALAAYPVALNGSHSVVPGVYLINRQISDDSPWILTLTTIQLLPSGQAEFFVKYANTGSTAGQLTCNGSSIGDETLTFDNGQTTGAAADFCSQHPGIGDFTVAAGQSHLDYAIFPDTGRMSQPFSFNWPATDLAGRLDDLQLPSGAVASASTTPAAGAPSPGATSAAGSCNKVEWEEGNVGGTAALPVSDASVASSYQQVLHACTGELVAVTCSQISAIDSSTDDYSCSTPAGMEVSLGVDTTTQLAVNMETGAWKFNPNAA
jgi:serine/threonine protein kinase